MVGLLASIKVTGPNLNTLPERAPIFEWCVVRCWSKNGHQKDMCLKEITLSAQILLIVLALKIIGWMLLIIQ